MLPAYCRNIELGPDATLFFERYAEILRTFGFEEDEIDVQTLLLLDTLVCISKGALRFHPVYLMVDRRDEYSGFSLYAFDDGHFAGVYTTDGERLVFNHLDFSHSSSIFQVQSCA